MKINETNSKENDHFRYGSRTTYTDRANRYLRSPVVEYLLSQVKHEVVRANLTPLAWFRLNNKSLTPMNRSLLTSRTICALFSLSFLSLSPSFPFLATESKSGATGSKIDSPASQLAEEVADKSDTVQSSSGRFRTAVFLRDFRWSPLHQLLLDDLLCSIEEDLGYV